MNRSASPFSPLHDSGSIILLHYALSQVTKGEARSNFDLSLFPSLQEMICITLDNSHFTVFICCQWKLYKLVLE